MSSFKKQEFPRFGKNYCTIDRLELTEKGNLHLRVTILCENPKSFYQTYSPNFDEEDAYETVKHIFSAVLGPKVVNKVSSGKSFKEFIEEAVDLLPEDLSEKEFDVFLQYQWNFPKDREGNEYPRTYTELPKKVKHGKFLIPRTKGYRWNKLDEYTDDTPDALTFVNKDGDLHPFVRSGWFMNSYFANTRKREDIEQTHNEFLDQTNDVEEPVFDDDLPF